MPIRARDNPFRADRVQSLPYRLMDTTWDALLDRLAALRYRAAIVGPEGSGKTTVTTTFLEQLCNAGYQFCVFDPEGDYHEFPGAIALRGNDARALVDEALSVLDRPAENVVVSLLDLRLEDRPAFSQLLLPRLLEMRAATARPHWIVLDEAHHLLPAAWRPSWARKWPPCVNASARPARWNPDAT